MCTNMFVWLLKILCQTCIAFNQNKIINDQKKNVRSKSKIWKGKQFKSVWEQ